MTKSFRPLVLNALVVALYVVLSVVSGLFNLAAGPIQFRLSESLNHLVAINRRYLVGVVIGVVLYNALFSPMGWVDVLFGGGQTLLGLGVVVLVGNRLPHLWQRMALTTATMSASMILIAVEIVWTGNLGWGALLPTYGGLLLSELAIMALSAPVMMLADRALGFNRRLEA